MTMSDPTAADQIPASSPPQLVTLPPAPALAPLQAPPPPPSPEDGRGGGPCFPFQRQAFRLTSEFDSDSAAWFHKASCKLLGGLAKLRFCFFNNQKGDVSSPQLGLITKNLSIVYDVDSRNALLGATLDLPASLQIRASHDVKERRGEVVMLSNFADASYKLQLATPVPINGLPKAALKFPMGEVSVEEKEVEESKRILSVNGVMKAQLMNGVCTALYKENSLNLRYCYKDEELSFIPTISLPSDALSFAFKRRFTPSDKLSYLYHFDSNEWSAVYKHTIAKDLKFKAGYDSEVRLGWASLWVGDETGKMKTAPMKMKMQFMLQVPQDDLRHSALMFRVKKRWDF